MTIKFSIVAAVDRNFGIGCSGKIPWNLKADMQHFKALTTSTRQPMRQNAVVMGRVTWESLPEKFRPLPNRLNIVISNKEDLSLPPGVLQAPGLDAALAIISTYYAQQTETIFLIGGAQLYQVGMNHPLCEKLYLTRIDNEFKCDVFFPKDLTAFHKISESPVSEEGDLKFSFETYERLC